MIPIIAKNNLGYKNLVKLSSYSHLNHADFNEPFCEFSDLEENKEGIIITLGGLNSLVGDFFKKDRLNEIEEVYSLLKELGITLYRNTKTHDLNEKIWKFIT